MPEFVNPFTGVVPGQKITDAELLRALRLDLSAEQEAVHLYLAHADATDNELAKKVLVDIANEERVHAGEFQRLISILTKDEDAFLAEGAGEVDEMAAGREPEITEAPDTGKEQGRDALATGRPIPTIGDLKH